MAKNRTYIVTLPITGKLCVEVDAESEEAAIKAALIGDDLILDNIEEWEAAKQICEGNFFHGMLNEAEAYLAPGEDADESEDAE